jgi:hypothetical protein
MANANSWEETLTGSKTERTQYDFTLKEFSDGTPWIMMEKIGPGLEVLRNGFVGFDLKAGTSLEEATHLAALLRRSISTVSYTSFEKR